MKPTSVATWRRRLISIPALFLAFALLTLTSIVWIPVLVVVDAVRLRWRLPTVRLVCFGWCWSWIESVGVASCARAWVTGRRRDQQYHYDLMAWWAAALVRSLTRTTGIRVAIEGADAVADGNAIVLVRHASLADALVSGWVLRSEIGVRPKYVLKRELIADPCLDIVGHRVPNHFVDRQATDNTFELEALRRLAAGADGDPASVLVIFPEGTRANDDKRRRALARVASVDPARAARLSGLRRLLPPRASGAAAMLEGAPSADVVVAWHVGFDGCDTFSGILDRLARPAVPARFVMRRIPRDEVPRGDGLQAWLDEQWLRMDAEVDAALAPSP